MSRKMTVALAVIGLLLVGTYFGLRYGYSTEWSQPKVPAFSDINAANRHPMLDVDARAKAYIAGNEDKPLGAPEVADHALVGTGSSRDRALLDLINDPSPETKQIMQAALGSAREGDNVAGLYRSEEHTSE